MITPPLCRACRRQHDPALDCPAESALSVYTPGRSARQGEIDHLEEVAVARYRFHRPLHRSARHRRRPSPLTAPLRMPSGSVPTAAAVVLVLLVMTLLVLGLLATVLR